MKKKIIGLMLAIATVLTLSAPFAVSANSEPPTTELGDIVSTNVEYFPEYGFTITEEMDVDNRIVLTLEREELTARELRSLDIDQAAYDTLTMLGFNQETIYMLTDEQLEAFATSTYIVTNVTYSRQDNLGNEIILTPEEAYDIAEWENSGENKIDIFPPSPLQSLHESGIITFSAGITDIAWRTNRFNLSNGVLDLRHAVARHNNDRVRHIFTTQATWISMPTRRRVDSVGSLANGISSFNQHSVRASMWYDWTGLRGTSGRTTVALPTTHAVNGIFQGFASPTRLVNFCCCYVVVSRLSATIIWEGNSHAPDFNSIASYHHSTNLLNINTSSISISVGIPNTPFSVSIGIPVNNNVSVRNTVLLVFNPPNWSPPTHPGW